MDARERRGRAQEFLRTVLRAGLACLAVVLLAGWTDPVAIAVAAILVLLFSWWIVSSRRAAADRIARDGDPPP